MPDCDDSHKYYVELPLEVSREVIMHLFPDEAQKCLVFGFLFFQLCLTSANQCQAIKVQ